MDLRCLTTGTQGQVPDLTTALAVLDAHDCRGQHRLHAEDGRVWATSPRILTDRIAAGDTDPLRWVSVRPSRGRSDR